MMASMPLTDVLTVAVIAQNASESIERTITAARDGGLSVIVVDGGSSDNTRELAAQCGAKVLEHRFENFSAQRNWALSQVPTEYVLFVDADEVVTPELVDD